MEIRYVLEGKVYETRSRDIVPKQGEYVTLRGLAYLIKRVIWIEDQPPYHVHLWIEKAL